VEPITVHTGRAVALRRSNVDTDQIIPAVYLKRVTRSGFGTGSSREHAVWALRDHGFRVVVSSKFADIFRGNAGKGGLVTACVAQPDVERLWSALDADPATEVTVDLNACTVSWASESVPFDIDDYTRWRLMEGLDDVDLTLTHADQVAAFEAGRPSWLPTTV
jgi:3-isopropylmalate/(R)-2-methylmalate dehydratase small subunit